ncbi:MAG: permease [Spirochaetales bacterium]|uniref:Permease n=1 Tax=Candidatus Thalassospirochaeta sargassi TaxID=3119039 RepID=A0AAJ1MIW7_9SPIO|nr:permease [Spirochaetales bacterium]
MLDTFREASLYFIAVILEASGFMLIGCLVGSLIEEFLPDNTIPKLIGNKPIAGILIAGLIGILFPICECAIVPVIRKLIKKGTPTPIAITFMLAVPIVNPVVGFSTYIAFSNNLEIAGLRLASGYFLAVLIGMLTLFIFKDGIDSQIIQSHAHSHDHCHHCSTVVIKSPGSRVKRLIEHTWTEFTEIAGFLFIGAGIAAIFRSSIPLAFLGNLKNVPGLSTLFMMAAAFILNLCSEADAFIAGSFTSLFSPAPLLAFMLVGPMLDIKLLIMYRTVFKPKLIIWLSVTIIVSVFLWVSILNFTGFIPELRR